MYYKKPISVVLATSLAFGMMSTPAFALDGSDYFTDVRKGAWYDVPIGDVVEAGLMNGYGGTTLFGPENTLLRAEMACILTNASDVKLDGTVDQTGLRDLVGVSEWFTASANWSFANDLIQGYDLPDGDLFAPYDAITREQAVVILARYAAFNGIAVSASGNMIESYPDSASVSSWSRDSIEWALEQGIISGEVRNGDSYLNPQRPVLRCEIAKMIVQTMRVITGNPDYPDEGNDDEVTEPEEPGDGGSGSGDGGYVEVPDAVGDLSAASLMYVGTDYHVTLDSTFASTVTWSFVDEGGKVYTADEIGAQANRIGATVTFPYAGNWTVWADMKGNNGKTVRVSDTYTVHNVVTIDFALPENTHTDESVTISPTHENVDTVEWSLIKDGMPVDISQYMTVEPEAGSVTTNFTQDGTYELTAKVTDTAGYSKSHTETIRVYPVINIEVIGEDYAHNGTPYSVSATVDRLDNIDTGQDYDINWSLEKYDEGSSSFVPATESDAATAFTVEPAGNSITYNNDGTYRIVAEITDAIGRTFEDSFDMTNLPVGEVGVAMGAFTHSDTSFLVQGTFTNIRDNEPVWTAELDGEPVAVSDVVTGDLGVDGGTVTPVINEGDITLIASFTDASGQTYTNEDTIHVYPIPELDIEFKDNTDADLIDTVSHDVWTDSALTLSPSISNCYMNGEAIEQSDVEWFIDTKTSDGTYERTLFADGSVVSGFVDSLGSNNVNLTSEGQYRVGYVLTDEVGREFTCYSDTAEPVNVLPVLDFDLTMLDEAWVGNEFGVGVVGDTRDYEYDWSLKESGIDVTLDDYVDGDLAASNNGASTISFNDMGEYTLGMSVTDSGGRVFEANSDISIHPNIVFDIDIPGLEGGENAESAAPLHLGDSKSINVASEYLDGANIVWSVLNEEGNPVSDEAATSTLDGTTGDVSFKQEGTYILRADIVDQYGGASTHEFYIDAWNEAPSAPVGQNQSIDFTDFINKFTTDAKVRVNTDVASTDAHNDAITYYVVSGTGEQVAIEDIDSVTGYFGLGTTEVQVKAVDEFGAESEVGTFNVVVNVAAPSAGSIDTSIDYSDVQNPYTSSAQVSVSAEGNAGTSSTPGVETKFEFESSSDIDADGTYLGKGSYDVDGYTIDAFGQKTPVHETVSVGGGTSGNAGNDADTGATFAKPTVTLTPSFGSSTTINSGSTASFSISSSGSAPYTVKTVDYYNTGDKTSNNYQSGSNTTSVAGKTYSDGRHIMVVQVQDIFGNAVYANKFFIVGSATAGQEVTPSQYMSVTEEGVFDGDTPLAYIKSFTAEMPPESGHNGSDTYGVKGYCETSPGVWGWVTVYSGSTSNGFSLTSAQVSGWNSSKYTKLQFYYNVADGHESCIASMVEGLQYTVDYTFIEDSSLEDNFANLFK